MKILSVLLPAIINGDVSGLTELEVKQVQTFVDNHPACIFDADEEEGYCNCDLTGLTGICITLAVIRPHFKTRYINSRSGAAIETLEAVNNLNYTDKSFQVELTRLVADYSMSDPTAYYYISNRSTASWRAK